jgi:predicted acylesterase/phospholipase RssA
LSPIEDSGLLEYADTYCGVSIGAMISLLIICGYKIREIVGEAVKLDLFKEMGSFNFQSIMENKGFISNEPIRRVLSQLVINKFGSIPTLYGLYMRTGKSYIPVTLNATDGVGVMLNPFENPDVSCVDATLFSMNIPFIFYQLIHKGKIYADGALYNPYPIDYFDDGKTNILGIYMKTIHTNKENSTNPTQSPGIIVRKVDTSTDSLPISSYFLKIIHSLIEHRRNHIIQKASDKCINVCLETKNVDTIGYTLTTDDKALMLVEGFNEGKIFLSQLRDGTYKGPTIPQHQTYTYPSYFMINEQDNNNSINILQSMTS